MFVVDDDLDNEYTLEELCDLVTSMSGRCVYSLQECITYLKSVGKKVYQIS